MSNDLRITIFNKEDLAEFITAAIIKPMKKGITGSVEVHILDGEIRAYEIKARGRDLERLKKHWGDDGED